MSSPIKKEKIIHKGAEASLFHGFWFDKEVIFKHRIPKLYRLEELDLKIRTERTLNEAKAMIKVKNYGLNVPQIFEIDIQNATIIMKYIEGDKLRDIVDTLNDMKTHEYFEKIGHYIAILHLNGHIHGDITTSNIIITKNQDIFLIDFGLHTYSDTIEDKSVDLHLFKRVLLSSHGKHYKSCFNAFLEGYKAEYGKINSIECHGIIKNINIIESRGRYVKSEERL